MFGKDKASYVAPTALTRMFQRFREYSEGKAEDPRSVSAASARVSIQESHSALLESRKGGKQTHTVETSNFNIPMAKRLSLQRFLQKRKDRVIKVRNLNLVLNSPHYRVYFCGGQAVAFALTERQIVRSNTTMVTVFLGRN